MALSIDVNVGGPAFGLLAGFEFPRLEGAGHERDGGRFASTGVHGGDEVGADLFDPCAVDGDLDPLGAADRQGGDGELTG
jgi:hypothetical protein